MLWILRGYLLLGLIQFTFQGLSLLPLMEPSITTSLDLFAPFGSSPANGKAPLKGSFGNAVLDNIPDYYSQLLTKVTLHWPVLQMAHFATPQIWLKLILLFCDFVAE